MTTRFARRYHHGQAGFTLIELMISLVLFSFAIAGVLSVAVAVTQGFREQRLAIEAENAARVPLDLIADALRQVSPGVAVPANVYDPATCTSGAISVTNSSTGPDQLDLIYASGAVVTSTRAVYDGSQSSLLVTDASQLATDDYVLITDFTAGHIVKITNVSGNTLSFATLTCTTGMPVAGYAIGSLVIRAQHARFSIANNSDTGLPTLYMDPDAGGSAAAEPLASGVEDMQIAVGVDADSANGISEIGTAANDDEWHYNIAGDNAPGGTIRAVRVTLIARTADPLRGGNSATAFTRPAAEDRAAGSGDAYRRRVLRTIVEMRNIGGSP